MKFFFNENIFLETIKKVNGKWVVYPKGGGKRLGTHDTKKAAKKQIQAIEISKATNENTTSAVIPNKSLINEYNYFSDVYEYSTNFVNRYIHIYGIKLRNVHNFNDLAYQGIYYDPEERYVHTIISNDPKNFRIPIIGETYKVFDVIFTSRLKNLGGQKGDRIYIKADTVDLISIDKYKETLEKVKNTLIHEVAHLLDEILHNTPKSMIHKKYGGLYSRVPSEEDNNNVTDPEVKKQWLAYLNQAPEINAFLNVALHEQAKILIDEFKEILKSDVQLKHLKFFMSINKRYNKKHLQPSLRWVLKYDYNINGTTFVENIVNNINLKRARATGVIFNPKNNKLFDLTEKQKKYIYRRAYPTFNKIYDKYAKELIEKLKNIKNENNDEN